MLERADRVLVTGASGFIGSALTRTLVADGQSVAVLLEPGADDRNLADLSVERSTTDIRDAAAVRRGFSGRRAVFHVAALYRFWAPHPRDFYEINVGGTRNVLGAARAENVERVVFTSTVGTLGLDGAGPDRGVDETSYPDVDHLFGSYKRSNYVAEHEALRAAAAGLSLSSALPTFPPAPRDRT